MCCQTVYSYTNPGDNEEADILVSEKDENWTNQYNSNKKADDSFVHADNDGVDEDEEVIVSKLKIKKADQERAEEAHHKDY